MKEKIMRLLNRYGKQVCAIIVALTLAVTNLQVNLAQYTVNASSDMTSLKTNVAVASKEQIKEAKEEDEKLKKQIEDTKESKEKNKKRTVVKELQNLRTSDSSTYLLSDGSRKLEIYGTEVHYKEDGKYVAYDSSLKEISKVELKELSNNKIFTDKKITAEYVYVNTAGDVKHYFPQSLNEDSSIILTKDDYAISFGPKNKENIEAGNENSVSQEKVENINVVDDDNTVYSLCVEEKNCVEDNVIYGNEKDKVSYKYTSLTSGVKEEIILEEKPDTNIFEFELSVPGMALQRFENSKEIRITDEKTGKLIAYIEEPNIKDSDGDLIYDDIYYVTEKVKDGEYILRVVVEEDYLNDKKTKYPITLDPTVMWTNDRLESASVSNFQHTLNCNLKHTGMIQIQNNAVVHYPNTEYVCYIDTSGIDANNALSGSTETFYGANIEDAYLSITEKDNIYNIGQSGTGTFTSGHIEVRTPVSTWDPDTITWNNHPGMGDRVWSQFKCTGVANTKHTVNLKDWAQAVADREIANTGLALKAVEDKTGANFYSSSSENANHMSLTIIYENPHTGEKDIYSYEDFSTPNGSGQIELSQGNYIYSQTDLSLPTPQLALEVSRTYNSRNTEKSSFGIGWSCDYDAYVTAKGTESLTYVDGTKAFYAFSKQQDSSWICNENPDLSVAVGSAAQTRVISATETNPSSTVNFTSYYIVTDKDKVKRYFSSDGKLQLIEEANGTFIYVKYHNTYGFIQSVYSSKGQKIDFEYSAAGGDYYVSKITLADNSSFNYTYADNRLTKVVHKGSQGNEIEYNYEYNTNGQLSKIIDAVGNSYQIEYDGRSVSSAIYPDNSRIDVYTNYEPLKTRVYTKNANNMILHYEEYEFDTYGKVLKVTNDLGNVTTYSYSGSLVTNTTEEVQYHEIQNGIVKTITPTGSVGDKHLEAKNEYNDRNNLIKETDAEGNVTVYTYGDINNPDFATKMKTTNSKGDVVAEIDCTYDSKGNLIKMVDYIGKTVLNCTYDSDGNPILSRETLVDDKADLSNVSGSTIASGLNNSTDTVTYDADGNILTGSYASGTISQTEQNIYDTTGLGRLVSTTDEKNIVTTYGYDEFGRVVSTTTAIPNEDAEVASTTYDLNGTVIEETDKVGRKTTYVYDNMGRVISKTLTYGDESRTTTTTYGYEDNFYVITGTGTNKRWPTVYVVTEKNANGEVVHQSYTDPYGRLVREESNGICSDYTYDKQGNVFSTYTRGVSTTNETTAKLVVTVYDKHGRLTDTIQNPVYRNGAFTVDATNSIVTSNKYDENGNLIEETDGKGNKTTYTYDEEGRLTKVSLADGTGTANETLYAYGIQNKDASGNIISTTDKTTNALGNISETVMNGAGQVLSGEDKCTSGSIKVTYEYDASGNKIKETNSNGSYITYSYNKENMLTLKYEYNTSRAWRKLTYYTYNEDDLLEKVCDYNVTSNTPTPYRYTIYEYDELKRLVGCSEINATSQPTESMINEHKLVYKYDIEDKLIEIRYPKAENDKLKGIKFEYNSYKWLVKIVGIVDENGTEVTRDVREYEYYNDSKTKTIKEYIGFLNNTSYIQKTYTYDIFDRVTQMSYADSINLSNVLEQYTYSYDKNSNIVSETIINNYPSNQAEKVNETRIYTYDSLNRMTTSSITDNTNQTVSNTAYTYDKVGNRTKVVTNDTITDYTYNELNQVKTAVVYGKADNAVKSQITYTYDLNGNQIKQSDSVTGEVITNEYDAMNQLTKSVKTTSGVTEYTQVNTYNYDGQRISKTDNGVTTYYYYQGAVLLYTTDADGNKTSQNVVGPQENIIATIRYEEDGQAAYFYNKDIRTSVTNVVDDAGLGVVSYKYDDYGTTTKYGNQEFYNEICYTSGVYDDLTSLHYLNARYYNPSTAMFMTQDSYRGERNDYGTWNLYAYCGGNPISYVDPSGHNAFAAPLYGYGAANVWNPSGWIALAAAGVLTVSTIYVVDKAYEEYKIHEATRKREVAYNPDPYARAGQKKQGRENKSKNRKKENFQSRNNKRDNKPAKPKKHTPGKNHRKKLKK